jgi:hypothetical protein
VAAILQAGLGTRQRPHHPYSCSRIAGPAARK